MNEIFGNFLKASTCKETISTFQLLCEAAEVSYPPSQNDNNDHCTFYMRLKNSLKSSWKAQSLFSKLDKKYLEKLNFLSHLNNKPDGVRVAKDFRILIVGAGPCGLRTAIEMALLGAKTVVIEKRDSFSRNNVLHLWPFTIEDLRALGAKKFNGRFCSGAIDHVSIRQLQLILMKAALLFGVEVHVNVTFHDLIAPTFENGITVGWRAEIEPISHPVSSFQFDSIIGADGRKNSLKGFERKEFRASLAIGITVNFIHKHTSAEAKVPEISGINFIYRQDFFRDLNRKHDIDLENIVYYKDDTHYFVMTAKKQSLIQREVFKQPYDDPSKLVHYNNIDKAALLKYALDAVNFSTNDKLPDLEVAINSYGLPDIALFDFTCMKSSVNASMFRDVKGIKLLEGLVGDGLLEPFWPRGTGIAKGFLASFDMAWMLRQWALKKGTEKSPDKSVELSLLAEREAIYRILAQTENKSISPKYSAFTIDPKTRYKHVPLKLKLQQVAEFYRSDKDNVHSSSPTINLNLRPRSIVPSSLTRNVSFVKSQNLLNWCQNILRAYKSFKVTDMSSSWKSGMALCLLIARYRPDLIDVNNLSPENSGYNNQLGFDIAEQHLGITPVMSGKEMAECEEVDDLLMVTYISQFYELFKNEKPSELFKDNELAGSSQPTSKKKLAKVITSSPVGLLTRLSHHIKRKSLQKSSSKEYDVDEQDAKRKKVTQKRGVVPFSDSKQVVLTKAVISPIEEDNKENTVIMRERPGDGGATVQKSAGNRVSALGLQLISQFEQNAPTDGNKISEKGSYKMNKTASDVCYFCEKRVYIVERLSVEGLFFHRQCFKCNHCDVALRPMNYKRDSDTGKFYCEIHFYANVDFNKPLPTRKSGTESRNVDFITHIAESGSVSEISTQDVDTAVEENATPLLATIENGEVVMKRDLTPSRGIMASFKLSISKTTNEVPEEILNQHNLSGHISDDPFFEDASSSSDSDMQDWNDIENEALSLQNQSSLQMLSDYHSNKTQLRESEQINTTGTSDATLLSSSSDGDSDVSSMTSSSKSSIHPDEDQESMSTVSEDDVLVSDQTANMDISSSEIRPDNVDIFQDLLLDQTCSDVKNNRDQSSIQKSSSEKEIDAEASKQDSIHRTDTLDRFALYIADNPVKRQFSISSSSSGEDVEDKIVSLSSVSSNSSVLLKEWEPSHKNDEDALICDEIQASPELQLSPIMKNSSSVWTSEIGEKDKVSLVNEASVKTFEAYAAGDSFVLLNKTQEGSGLHLTSPYIESDNIALMNESLIFDFKTDKSPVSSENDMFFTPSGKSPNRTELDSFYTVDTDVSLNNSYLSEMTPKNMPVERGATIKVETGESASKRSPRKLPETPKITGRRLLPVIPKIHHLEALSPTGLKSSSEQPESIDFQMKLHEKRVQARILLMKSQAMKQKSNEYEESDNFENYDLPSRRNAVMPRKRHKHQKKVLNVPKENKPMHRSLLSNPFAFKNKKKHGKAKDPVSSPDPILPEEINNKIARRVRIAAQKQAQQAEQKRLARALVIQRQLEEVDMKRKLLEENGVQLEKNLRSDEQNTGSSRSRHRDSSVLMHDWFKLVQEKNALLRYENELMIYQRELQLEDRQSRLQQELRERMAVDDSKKSSQELAKEKIILNEMLDVVEQRDQLVALLDEHRVQDKEESADIEGVLLEKFSKISSGNDSYLASS